MKLVFLCGSLEPGRDGVGDYTRRLAAELVRQNHQAVIIALHDCQIRERMREESQAEDGQTVYTLRLSSASSWSVRSDYASAFIRAFDPDWVSLQYVPYSFHNKGLPLTLPAILRQLTGSRPVHIMFHELWVGLSKQSPKRHVVWGHLQRHLVRTLLTTLQPASVHTHTPLYVHQLEQLGCHTVLLPLFSNIQRVPPPDDAQHGMRTETLCIRFVAFGGLAPAAPVYEFAGEVIGFAKKRQLTAALTLIGRVGCEQEVWATAWRAHGLTVDVLGEQPSTYVSRVLTQSSVGISTTPAVLSGKSGVIAAMHAHNLPVLCVAAPWHPRDGVSFTTAPGILNYTIGNLEQLVHGYAATRLPVTRVTDTVRQLLDVFLPYTNQIPST